MNKSNNSSTFDAHNYYQKLTNCLAIKNNYKVNLKAISGTAPKIKKPLITKQHMQAKFLAKYNSKTKAEEEQNQVVGGIQLRSNKEGDNLYAARFIAKERSSSGFKKNESYVNLSESFFGSFKDLPVAFKKPLPPPPPKTTTRNDLHEVLTIHDPSANTAMVTMNISATSTNFKPKEASTPLEKSKPMISDPDILSQELIKQNLKAYSFFAQQPVFEEKSVNFMKIIDKNSIKIHESFFPHQPDPFADIQQRILETFEVARRSPRMINETLMSEIDCNRKEPTFQGSFAFPKRRLLPVPVFYEPKKNKNINETSDIFDCATLESNCRLKAPESIFKTNFTINKALIEESPGWSPVSNLKTIASPEAMPFFETNKNDYNDELFNWSPRDPMNWQTTDTPKLDNSFAIFYSPPHLKSRATVTQKSQCKLSRGRSSQKQPKLPNEFLLLSERQPVSQRPQRSFLQRSQNESTKNEENFFNETLPQNSDASLSTYKWTPNIPNLSLPTLSGLSPHYQYEPRNIFKNSNNLF